MTRRIGRAGFGTCRQLAVQGRANNLRFLASAAVSSMRAHAYHIKITYVFLPCPNQLITSLIYVYIHGMYVDNCIYMHRVLWQLADFGKSPVQIYCCTSVKSDGSCHARFLKRLFVPRSASLKLPCKCIAFTICNRQVPDGAHPTQDRRCLLRI